MDKCPVIYNGRPPIFIPVNVMEFRLLEVHGISTLLTFAIVTLKDGEFLSIFECTLFVFLLEIWVLL